uniref:Uncharacterized protein n=1 Tax=Peronospora matthiolae TaxID=2874970 RepID=A0AAV1TQ60_9STRA
MGCCLSREDDHSGGEVLLPKGRTSNKRVDNSIDVDPVKKEGSASGSYKSPSAVVAAADVNTKVPTKPQPVKKPVENVDLLGLDDEAPTPLRAETPAVRPHKLASKTTPLPREATVSSKTSSKTPVEADEDNVMASALTSVAVKTENVDKVKGNDRDQDIVNDRAGNTGGKNDEAKDTLNEPKPKKISSTKKSKKKRKKSKK